jgi:hypothetical protein
MVTVVTSTEHARGCGYRKPSKNGVGIYLVGPGLAAPCGRLPLPLTVCPCCSAGIKPTRGWTWIEPSLLFPTSDLLRRVPRYCCAGLDACRTCPVGIQPVTGKHGLLWTGEKFYRSPHIFMAEARQMGVSRKLGAIPNGFKLGETWVFLAHRLTIPDGQGGFTPGIFTMFRPTGVDLVIDDADNVPERAVKLAEQIGDGTRIVKVIRDVDTQGSLFSQQQDSP